MAQKPSCVSSQPRWWSRIGVVLCSWSLRDEGSGWVRGLRFQPTGVSWYPFTVPSARPLASIQYPCVSCPPPLPTRVALAKSLTRPMVLPDRTRLSFRTNTGLAQGRRSGNEEAPGLQAAAFRLGLWEVGGHAAPSEPEPPDVPAPERTRVGSRGRRTHPRRLQRLQKLRGLVWPGPWPRSP